MALIKRYELANGIDADSAYHVISQVITHKIPTDIPDPGGVRPANCPDWQWKKGYYGRVCVQVFYNKAARDAGKLPIAHIGVYPTDVPADMRVETKSETNFWMTIDMESTKTVVEQAYDFLKTMSYYSDAVED
jgi:hypothetical protein